MVLAIHCGGTCLTPQAPPAAVRSLIEKSLDTSAALGHGFAYFGLCDFQCSTNAALFGKVRGGGHELEYRPCAGYS